MFLRYNRPRHRHRDRIRCHTALYYTVRDTTAAVGRPRARGYDVIVAHVAPFTWAPCHRSKLSRLRVGKVTPHPAPEGSIDKLHDKLCTVTTRGQAVFTFARTDVVETARGNRVLNPLAKHGLVERFSQKKKKK